MNRVDPREVARFFRERPDVAPIQKKFRETTNNQITGCCGLTAAVLSRSDDQATKFMARHSNPSDMGDHLGLTASYVLGFVRGWDDVFLAKTNEHRKAGVADGRMAFRLVQEDQNQ